MTSTEVANDADGFTMVSSKKPFVVPRRKNRKGKQPAFVERTVQDKVERRRVTLHEAGILQSFTDVFDSAFASTSTCCHRPTAIVCLGLGSVTDSAAAQSQFAILQHLLHVILPGSVPRLYDPVHTAKDRAYFVEAGFQPLSEEFNLALQDRTLLYMPYCPLSLYDELLRENWSIEGLSRIVLLGNRLDMYEDPMHPRLETKGKEKAGQFVAKAAHLFMILNLPKEDSDTPTNVVRDQALQWIPRGRLEELDQDFWCFTPIVQEEVKLKAEIEIGIAAKEVEPI